MLVGGTLFSLKLRLGYLFAALGFFAAYILGVTGHRLAGSLVRLVLGRNVLLGGFVLRLRHGAADGAGTYCKTECSRECGKSVFGHESSFLQGLRGNRSRTHCPVTLHFGETVSARQRCHPASCLSDAFLLIPSVVPDQAGEPVAFAGDAGQDNAAAAHTVTG